MSLLESDLFDLESLSTTTSDKIAFKLSFKTIQSSHSKRQRIKSKKAKNIEVCEKINQRYFVAREIFVLKLEF
jgi:hypothetical protein